jgi:hypothetical protein
VVLFALLPLPPLLQAARAVILATARARTPIRVVPNLVIAPFLALLAPRMRSGVISFLSFSRRSPVIHCATSRGAR